MNERTATRKATTMVTIAPAALALCEVLLKALFAANALDLPFALQAPGHAFEAIRVALVTTLTNALDGDEALALRLYEEAIDNGEDIAYQVDLLNRGIIEV